MRQQVDADADRLQRLDARGDPHLMQTKRQRQTTDAGTDDHDSHGAFSPDEPLAPALSATMAQSAPPSQTIEACARRTLSGLCPAA
jgi:hypothetical protein